MTSEIQRSLLRCTIVCLIVISIGGCATSKKVQVVQQGDKDLTCRQIDEEIVKLDAAEAEVNNKKGVTGSTIAGALFWLPGLLTGSADAGKAKKAIDDRRTHLTTLQTEKGCNKAT